MALINTTERSTFPSNALELAALLRMALVEELAAVNTYTDLANAARRTGLLPVDGEGNPREIPEGCLTKEAADMIAEAIDEIRKDENQHVGKLLGLMSLLDKKSNAEMREGSKGA
jgi:rubrerythrin